MENINSQEEGNSGNGSANNSPDAMNYDCESSSSLSSVDSEDDSNINTNVLNVHFNVKVGACMYLHENVIYDLKINDVFVKRSIKSRSFFFYFFH